MAERRRAEERESTYSWVKGLERFQGRYDKLVAAMAAHLNHAQNLQPIQGGVIPTIIEELYNGVQRTKHETETWYQTALVVMRRDMDRVDNPAGGSADRERRGDAGYNARDV